MRKACVMVNQMKAGILEELKDKRFLFTYHDNYQGPPVSLTMPIKEKSFYFTTLPPFFEGLLPEGIILDKKDLFGQLLTFGKDRLGAVSILEVST